MADVLVVSCRLCLQADEATSLVTIHRPLASSNQSVELSICRPCARAIDSKLQELDGVGAAETASSTQEPTASSALSQSPAAEEEAGQAAASSNSPPDDEEA